ncbi:MAG: DUF4339 domain-containing protein [Chlamydiota bacterium]
MSLSFYLIAWTVIGYLSSRIARNRGRNPLIWFALGIILGLIAVIVLYILPSKRVVAPVEILSGKQDGAPSDSASETLWYYLDRNNRRYGPMSFDALKNARDSDRIDRSTYVWNENMKGWETLESLSDLPVGGLTPKTTIEDRRKDL